MGISALNADDVKVSEFGAIPDAKTDNTSAIQSAIDKCTTTGGGEVFFDKKGVYLSATINLKDNVIINIPQGATLKGLKTSAYKKALIVADGVKNIGVIGKGTINGTGKDWFENKDGKIKPISPRPFLLRFNNSKNIKVEDVFMTAPAGWTFHLYACEDVFITRIKLHGHANYNNDGLDIMGKNIIISDCHIDSFDDAIVIKNLDPKYQVENITITNCILRSCASALKIGTETRGSFKNIVASNCVIGEPSECNYFYEYRKGFAERFGISPKRLNSGGIVLTTVDGGQLENVKISGITMSDVQVPICIRVGHRNRGNSPDINSGARNIIISDIIAKSESWIASSISSIPNHQLENVSIKNCMFLLKAGASSEMLDTAMTEKINENPKNVPGPKVFGRILPASAFYIRHANNVEIGNVTIQYWNGTEKRPPFFADDVSNLKIKNCLYEKSKSETFAKILENCKGTIIEGNTEIQK